jgi:branched-chain amino acid transport system substrate-binding protein
VEAAPGEVEQPEEWGRVAGRRHEGAPDAPPISARATRVTRRSTPDMSRRLYTTPSTLSPALGYNPCVMRAAALVASGLVVAALVVADPAATQVPKSSGAGSPASPRDTGSKDATKDPAGKEATPKDTRPPLPTYRIGALLPLTGPSAWFGKELRQGMELAVTELNRPRRPIPRVDPLAATPGEDQKATMAAQRANQALGPSPGVSLVLDAADVQPANLKQATDQFGKLAAATTPVVVTATTTPTLAIQSSAAARDVLVLHEGLVLGRFPTGSRTILHARPAPAVRAEAVAAYAAERKLRRLVLLAAGDDFGKAVRAGLTAAWRERGGTLQDESLTLEAPDLASRLRQVVRRAPEAVVLGFRGPDLGDLAARLREAGYVGPLLIVDDDPAALLAAGPALQGATVVSDAFVPELGTLGERFAEAYAKKFGGAPSRYAAAGYDAVQLVANAVRSALEQRRGPPGGGRLREALLAGRRFPSVFGGAVAVREDGSLVRPLALFTVEDGTLAFVRYVTPGPA